MAAGAVWILDTWPNNVA